MARGRARWGDRELRLRMPLPHERAVAPRSDGEYAGEEHVLRFALGDAAELDGESATWTYERGVLRVSSASWVAEGTIGHTTTYLRATRTAAPAQRVDWVMPFEPDGPPRT